MQLFFVSFSFSFCLCFGHQMTSHPKEHHLRESMGTHLAASRMFPRRREVVQVTSTPLLLPPTHIPTSTTSLLPPHFYHLTSTTSLLPPRGLSAPPFLPSALPPFLSRIYFLFLLLPPRDWGRGKEERRNDRERASSLFFPPCLVSALIHSDTFRCCSVLQCVAVCCSVLQLQCVAIRTHSLLNV